MAGYFSNHSHQSRFLANANSGSTQTTTTPAVAPPPSAPNPAPSSRSRLPSAKFSSSLSSGDEKTQTKERSVPGSVNGSPGLHPLRNTWVFWYRQHRAPGNKITNYEEGIKKISAFGSVESFWSLFSHLNPPSALLPTTDYLLFHSGIRRPVWEDPLNITGGKWIIRLKKGVADRLWEDLVLAIVGDQFDDCGSSHPADGRDGGGGIVRSASESTSGEATTPPLGDWPEICGCTISVRQSEDIVSIWNRYEGDPKVRERIRDTIRRVLNLPLTTTIEYKSNTESMQDKSSFRNPNNDRTTLS
ncbi:hypothetical protein JAAARDRAFT_54711 [Jaapia argillacea MUCL 33604]|uniref:Eukaryotic translation initiation factor 4E class II n=1 Tax=Jaapia argillacea MUCL 33604 TaxID=933084 RepID=A0A067Q2W5_9AGAM|nr:hypothetical protein JAAARDRAFT_54711 [Jaapia argillacea MUCL 33604]